MARRNGFLIKWGLCLILILLTLSLAVCGAEQQPKTVFNAKLVNNFEVFDADLRDAFRGLAEYGGFNVLMDKKVQGDITIKFQAGLNVKEAIDVLAKTNGYSCYWMPEQQTVVVGDETTYKNMDTMYTRVYNLKYADPETVAETLKVIVPKDRLGIDKRSNQLVVKGNVLEQENIGDTIAGLDREMPQISIEMRIEETTRTALDELGVGWGNDNFSIGNKKPDLKFTKLLANIDSLALKFWEEKTQSKILARPMISTTDSKEATIFIGDKVPLIKKQIDDNSISYDVEFIDVGTKLVVTPRINADNIVTVNVKAMLSNVTKTIEVGDDETKYAIPYVRNREASSVIRLRDGETFMLSGLNQNESSLTKQGLKGFQKIPLLGKLFQSTKKEDPGNDTEIVIFVTPRIIRSETPQAPTTEQPQKAENVTPAAGGVAAVSPLQPPAVRTAAETDAPAPSVNAPIPVVTESKPAPAQQALLPSPNGGKRLKIQVKPHQTVTGIAALYGVPEAELLKDNGLSANAALNSGRELIITIPADHIYHLAAKETLWRISKRYGVSLEVLQEINQLADVTKVQFGQAIILPVATTAIVAENF
jgi:type II secretory pathway component GspD/PulD (secretin)/LysM repeat protein